MNKYTSSNPSNINHFDVPSFSGNSGPNWFVVGWRRYGRKECCGNGFVVEYNRGPLGAVLGSFARGSGSGWCIRYLRGLLDTFCVAYNVLLVPCRMAVSHSFYCVFVDYGLFVYSLGCLLACLLGSLSICFCVCLSSSNSGIWQNVGSQMFGGG